MNPITKHALVNALTAAAYVSLVASFMFNASKFFGHAEPDTVLAPIFLLLLFVFSAALMGSLIFGRPALWYLDGKKKEALLLLTYTLGIFFIILVLVLLAIQLFVR